MSEQFTLPKTDSSFFQQGWIFSFLPGDFGKVLFFLLTILAPIPAWSGYQEGWEAYKRGEYVEALKEWTPLAENGAEDAQYQIGIMYLKGNGIADFTEVDKTRNAKVSNCWLSKSTHQWYSKAIAGDSYAQYRLGHSYNHGQGVKKDRFIATRWYLLAAEQGQSHAQYEMGQRYFSGEAGITQDYGMAHLWANLAAANGDRSAPALRETVARYMSVEQVARAQQLASQWKPLVLTIPEDLRASFSQFPPAPTSCPILPPVKEAEKQAFQNAETEKLNARKALEEAQERATAEKAQKPKTQFASVESIKDQYLAMVEDAIDQRWVAPPLTLNNHVVILKFRIAKSGYISQVHMVQSSGNDHYDSTAFRAVQAVNPLPPFPPNLQKSFIDVSYRFIKQD